MRALSVEEAEALRDLALPDHPGKTLPADELLVVRGCARLDGHHAPRPPRAAGEPAEGIVSADVCYARHATWLALPIGERRDLEAAAAQIDFSQPLERLVACEHGCGAREDEPCRDTDCGPGCRCPCCDVDDRRDRQRELAGYRRSA